jgi:hypothetical protein
VNGVSDAVYHIKGSGKSVQRLHTKGKLQWLAEQGRLPLPAHQACGTLFFRVKRLKAGFNPNLGKEIQVLRSTIERVEGTHVLELARTDSLIPVDDQPVS